MPPCLKVLQSLYKWALSKTVCQKKKTKNKKELLLKNWSKSGSAYFDHVPL